MNVPRVLGMRLLYKLLMHPENHLMYLQTSDKKISYTVLSDVLTDDNETINEFKKSFLHDNLSKTQSLSSWYFDSINLYLPENAKTFYLMLRPYLKVSVNGETKIIPPVDINFYDDSIEYKDDYYDLTISAVTEIEDKIYEFWFDKLKDL